MGETSPISVRIQCDDHSSIDITKTSDIDGLIDSNHPVGPKDALEDAKKDPWWVRQTKGLVPTKNCIISLISLRTLACILFGQFISLLITGTGVTSQLLATKYDVSIPTTQSLLNYILLALVYGPLLLYLRWNDPSRKLGESSLRELLFRKWWLFILLAFMDVEGNYLVVKAYQYTSITSVMLLDCFTIPSVMVLSFFFLSASYNLRHYLGVCVCVLGLGGLVLSDALLNERGGGSNPLVGDLLCIAGSVLYASTNVGEEFAVKKYDRIEYVAKIGCFGTIIGGLQLAILERGELKTMTWNYAVVGLIVGFSLCLFGMYSLVPLMLQWSSATFLNLSLLTSDVFAIVVAIFLFNAVLSPWYFLAFAVIIVGLLIYYGQTAKDTEANPFQGDDEPSMGEVESSCCALGVDGVEYGANDDSPPCLEEPLDHVDDV